MLLNDEIKLNEVEKKIFLKVLLKLIVADGVVDDSESLLIRKIGTVYRLTPEMLAEAKANFKQPITDEELAQISSRQKCFELVKALCLLASSDDNFDDKELDFIIDIAGRLKISNQKLVEINQLVQDILLLKEKNDLIMEIKS